MNSKKFIITKDPDVAKKLATAFKQINNFNGTWVFLNEVSASFNFEQFDRNKFAYTNVLMF